MNKIMLFVSVLLFGLSQSLHAEVITIDKVPAELAKLKAAYKAEVVKSTTSAKFKKLEKEFTQAKIDSLLAPQYVKQREGMEMAMEKEIQLIQSRYKVSLDNLEKETLKSVEKKYEKILADAKKNSVENVHAKYISDLGKIEKQLIGKDDLAGALVVQTERKKVIAAGPESISAPTVIKKVKPVASTPAKKESQPKHKKPETAKKTGVDKPVVYSSQTKGVAGSAGNVSNNIYTFKVSQVGKRSSLIFHAYGRETNKSEGLVFVLGPDGSRHEVTEWTPHMLKSLNFRGVKSADDVEPVTIDISKYVQRTGTYKVEFVYTGGDESLLIYKVAIRTW